MNKSDKGGGKAGEPDPPARRGSVGSPAGEARAEPSGRGPQDKPGDQGETAEVPTAAELMSYAPQAVRWWHGLPRVPKEKTKEGVWYP